MNKVVPIMMAMALTAPLSLSAMPVEAINDISGEAAVVVESATKPEFTSHSAEQISKADDANVLLKKRLHGLQQYQAAFNQTVTDAQGNICLLYTSPSPRDRG